MKLHILSDLHIEFGPFEPPLTDADTVVLAGDIGVGNEGLEWAATRFRHVPVIYVPGNHEFYGYDVGLLDELRTDAPANVHVLDNEVVELDRVRFLGCVLWSDFALYGEAQRASAMQCAREGVNDFAQIRNGDRAFDPRDAADWHVLNRSWLAERLAEPFAGRTVIVTHHAPSPRSIAPQHPHDLTWAAFASNLEGLMAYSDIVLWIHGHMHDSFDYEVDDTRVVCNPRGYHPHWLNNGFVPDLVVEI